MRSWTGGTIAQAALMPLACLVAWLVARPYEGIALDAQLYSLQAIAASKPFPLADDIFLRYGSQNNFTIFPRLVSPLIGWVGLEAAAAIIVIASYFALLSGGWLLSRRLTDTRSAWLSVGLLITVPGWYGALDVFRYDEMYLNARVPAEALAVLALWCLCTNRSWPAAFLSGLAGAIHPVMAVPAWGLMILLVADRIVAPRFGDRAAILISLVGAAAVASLAFVFRPDVDVSHQQWLETLRARTSYAFLQDWRIQDWLQNLLPLATLLTASTAFESRLVRRLALFSALIGIIGLVLAAVASNVPGFERLLLAQSWRWMWLSRFIAIVMLPGIVIALIRSGAAGRSVALLLASGWALFAYSGGAIAAVAMTVWFARRHLPDHALPALRAGSRVVGSAALALLVLFSWQAIPLGFDNNIGPIWVQRLIDAGGLDGPPALAMVAVWWVAGRHGSRVLPLAAVAALAVCLAGVVKYNLARFEDPQYSRSRYEQFEAWRRIIPPSAEVLWFADPAAVWTMLERKSYLSVSQSAGLMYSPLATREFLRRSQALAPLADPGVWTLAKTGQEYSPKRLTPAILAQICREPTLGFVVSPEKFDGFSAMATWPSGGHTVFLYDCAKYRGDASP